MAVWNTEKNKKEGHKLCIKVSRSVCSPRAYRFCWPIASPTISGQVNICHKLCTYLSHFSLFNYHSSKATGKSLHSGKSQAGACPFKNCFSLSHHTGHWFWPKQELESEVKRTTVKHQGWLLAVMPLGHLPHSTLEPSTAGRFTPSSTHLWKDKGSCLRKPLRDPQGERLTLQGG